MISSKRTKEVLDTLKPIESLPFILSGVENSINGPDVHNVGVAMLNETRRKLLSVLQGQPEHVFELEREIDRLREAPGTVPCGIA